MQMTMQRETVESLCTLFETLQAEGKSRDEAAAEVDRVMLAGVYRHDVTRRRERDGRRLRGHELYSVAAE